MYISVSCQKKGALNLVVSGFQSIGPDLIFGYVTALPWLHNNNSLSELYNEPVYLFCKQGSGRSIFRLKFDDAVLIVAFSKVLLKALQLQKWLADL